MTTLTGICGQPLIHALGWTLLHLCWQGALVAVALWCVLGLLVRRSSQARYAASCLALGLMVALPLATFVHLASKEYRLRAAFDGPAAVIAPGMTLQVGAGNLTVPWLTRAAVALDHALPWMLLAWFAGVLFFAVRLNVGLMLARRMGSVATTAPPAELQQVFDALRRRLGVTRAVRLMHSALVHAPAVVGWLRPVVLVPASCLTGLSAMQIEAVLAHELAHIRRHDYMVNVAQSVVETLLFYHPAVWWVSKQVRRERECCCDELAVAVGGDRQAYARALLLLEERRFLLPEFALGANGGVFTMRIKRLLGCKQDSAASQLASIALLVVLVLAGGAVAVRIARAQYGAPQTGPTAPISTQVAPEPAGVTQSPVGDAAQGPAKASDSPLPATARKTTPDNRQQLQSTQNKLSTEHLESQIEDLQRQLQDTQKKLDSEQFKKQMDDAQRQVQALQAELDNPAFKKQPQIEARLNNQEFKKQQQIEARLNSQEFKKQRQIEARLNSPQFKMQMDNAQRQIQALQEALNSPQFKMQMDNAQRQIQALQEELNSPQFKKQMDNGQRQVQALQAELDNQEFKKQQQIEARLNSPQFKKQMDNGQRQIQALQATLNSPQFKKQMDDAARAVARVNTPDARQNAMIAQESAGPLPQLNSRPAQTDGAIAGSIVDQTGAVVPRAKITTVNTDTGTRTVTETNNSGSYSTPPLPPGPYNVEVQAEGFMRLLQENVRVDSGKTVGLNLKLTAAQASGAQLVPAAPPLRSFSGAPLHVPAGAVTADLIHKVDPVYPATAKAAHVQGTVILHATISKTGTVEHLTVVSGAQMLRASARDAVGQWKYKPYLLNGQPVAVETTIEVHFALNGAPGSQGQNAPDELPTANYAGGPVENVGGDVSGPVPIYRPAPEYTPEARKAKQKGIVLVGLVVDPRGLPRDVHVLHGLGDGLDQKAVEAVKNYRFKPAMQRGKPVPVAIDVEINFQIF